MLDIRTILILSAVIALVMGVAMLVTARSYSGPSQGMKEWGLACVLQSIGWVLIALRGRVPDALSVVAGNTLLVLSYGLFYKALKAFNEEEYFRPGLYMVVAATFLLLIYFSFVTPSLPARAVVVAVGGACFFFLSARLVLSRTKGARPFSYKLTGGAFLFFVGVAVARVTDLLFVDRSINSIFARNPMHDILYGSSCVSIGVLTGCN